MSALEKEVAPFEKNLHQNHYVVNPLVFSVRISLRCSCAPTSWIRKTFLESLTRSWCFTAVMRMEREYDWSGWLDEPLLLLKFEQWKCSNHKLSVVAFPLQMCTKLCHYSDNIKIVYGIYVIYGDSIK